MLMTSVCTGQDRARCRSRWAGRHPVEGLAGGPVKAAEMASSPRPACMYNVSNRSRVGETPRKGQRRNAIPFPSIGLMILFTLVACNSYEYMLHVVCVRIDYVYMYVAGRRSELHAAGPAGTSPALCPAGGQLDVACKCTTNMATWSSPTCMKSFHEHCCVLFMRCSLFVCQAISCSVCRV